MTITTDIREMAQLTYEAAGEVAMMSHQDKNQLLTEIAASLRRNSQSLIATHLQDLSEAKLQKGAATSQDEVRLGDQQAIERLAHEIELMAADPDPIGVVQEELFPLANVCRQKRSIPLGPLLAICKSPDQLLKLVCSALKSSNSMLLLSGKEGARTNGALIQIIRQCLYKVSWPLHSIQLIAQPDRATLIELLKMNNCFTALIVHGNAMLQKFCRQQTELPMICGGATICHLFIDQSSRWQKASDIIYSAKLLPSNNQQLLNVLLVHHTIASFFLPPLMNKLGQAGICFQLDPKAWQLSQQKRSLISATVALQQASPESWDKERPAFHLAIKLVDHLDEAIDHILLHGNGACDGIFTEQKEHISSFIQLVDSTCLYVNSSPTYGSLKQPDESGSTPFVATQKLAPRGPIGAKELTSCQWVIHGA